MEVPYPTTIEEIEPWRRLHGLSLGEARARFGQFVVLESIASAPDLARAFTFKGGNALRFVYGNRRGTIDLDFTAAPSFPDDEARLRTLLNEAFSFALNRYRVKARCQRVRRNPAGRDKTWPTYEITAGYLLPGDAQYKNFDGAVFNISHVIEIEVSINEVVCEAFWSRLSPGGGDLAVCSLEDILAEKLRALLQQPIRKRNRPQDVFDIASTIRRRGSGLDLAKLSRYLLLKAAARGIEPRKSGFDKVVRDLASYSYEAEIRPNAPDFIPFAEAWAEVIALVIRLSIPE